MHLSKHYFFGSCHALILCYYSRSYCCVLDLVYLWQGLDALSSHLDDGLRGAGGGGADIFHDQSCGGKMMNI